MSDVEQSVFSEVAPVKEKKVKSADFDLSEFDTSDEADMVVMHPQKDEPTTWVITFAGPGHAVTVAQSNRMARERRKEEAEKERARVNGKKWSPPNETDDEVKAKNLSWITERILRWTPVRINGEDFPFTPANALKLIGDPRKGNLFQQCLDFLIADQTFMKRSGKK